METKRCTKCQTEKPLEEFYKNSRASDGRQSWCKPCQTAAVVSAAKKNPVAHEEANRKYQQSDKYKATRKARREGPKRERILEQKRQSWDRNKDEANQRVREARVTDPDRFKEYNDRRYATRKDEILEQNRAWAEANKDKVLAAHRKRVYGLTPEEYDRMLQEQAGLCAICGTDMHLAGEVFKSGTRRIGICVDHCHDSKRVRALLCPSCNKGLGYFKDDPVRMRAAADYIEKHGAEDRAA